MMTRPRSNSIKSFSTNNSIEGQHHSSNVGYGGQLKIKPRHKILPQSHASFQDKCFHYIAIFLLALITFVILLGELFILPKNEIHWCQYAQQQFKIRQKEEEEEKSRFDPRQLQQEEHTRRRRRRLQVQWPMSSSRSSNTVSDLSTTTATTTSTTKQIYNYDNPDFDSNPCLSQPTIYLLFLSKTECDWGRRMLLSVALGAIVGFERKSSDRPAGIRTMSLVSLGSCFFTICSMTAFRYTSTMGWDAARVSAAIPSGVGFIGAGLIYKGTIDTGTPHERQEVHGLTTAASVWLSAAIGVGCGGALFVVSVYATSLVIFVLRIGPRLYLFEQPKNHPLSSWDQVDESYNDFHTYESSSITLEQQEKEKLLLLNETTNNPILPSTTIESYLSTENPIESQDIQQMDSLNCNISMRRCISQVEPLSDTHTTKTFKENPSRTLLKQASSQRSLRRIQSDATFFSNTGPGNTSGKMSRYKHFSQGPTFVN